MDVLVIGGGGREHALTWALDRSHMVDRLCCAPGNAGIAHVAECWNLRVGNLEAVVAAVLEQDIDMVVVGPEAPLTAGLADRLQAQGIPCFGPSQRAAVLEGSKAFAKAFMSRHDIPTSPFEVFDAVSSAEEFAADPEWGFPVVVKADGLAAGKGVVICHDPQEARKAVQAAMVDGAYGAAGRRVVIEAFVEGVEASCMALCDGEEALSLLPSQDHKAAHDGGEGPNTGGMGAYAPAEAVVDEAMADRIHREILEPAVRGMAQEDRTFQGVLYAGLMITDDGPRVLEFNCRFGDPEAQVLVPLLDEDFAERLAAIANGEGVGRPLNWSDRSCACVVLASEGYPDKSPTGLPIHGLDDLSDDDVMVFHAGTAREDEQLVTAGGRVLGVTALGSDLENALGRVYGAVERIRFEGMQYRTDIGRHATRSSA